MVITRARSMPSASAKGAMAGKMGGSTVRRAAGAVVLSGLILVLSVKDSTRMLGARNAATQPVPRPEVKLPPMPKWIDAAPPRNSSRPDWCRGLIEQPRERSREPGDCGRGRFSSVCSDGAPRFFSQYNQDCFLYVQHFRHLKRPGVYLDVGATEPLRYSNTWFYDSCLGWTGACVEANARFHKSLKQYRTCSLVRRCVSDRVANVTFIDAAGLSGAHETNVNKGAWARRNESEREEHRMNVQCARTNHALAPLGMYNIDLLSLDVEGEELQVLRGIDWKKTNINVIVMDHATEQIHLLLKSLGYKQLPVSRRRFGGRVAPGAIWTDIVFIKNNVVWGKPV